MQKYNLSDFLNGWFIGDFIPSIAKTSTFEVGIKKYVAGDKEERHHHRVATEITIIIVGQVMMNGQLYEKDDILVIDPFESTDFNCLTDVTTCVIKIPSCPKDKYFGDYSI